MKVAKIILLYIFFVLFWIPGFCQITDEVTVNEPELAASANIATKKLNFFIVSKRNKGKLDPATRFNIIRSKLKSLFRRQKFVSIIAEDLEQANAKISIHLNKNNAKIGTLWFDSHGMYKKGYSLFFVGKDEISFKTLKDKTLISTLHKIAANAEHESKIIIGSCYGGATYHRFSIDYKDTTRMNGDSLMIELGNIFTKSIIYGSESWVMTKPGLFLERPAVAGYPGRNLFHDVCYKPVWENLSKWNEYNAVTKKFTSVNPVTLDKYGNLKVRIWAYTGHEDVTKIIIKNLEKLQPGLYK